MTLKHNVLCALWFPVQVIKYSFFVCVCNDVKESTHEGILRLSQSMC